MERNIEKRCYVIYERNVLLRFGRGGELYVPKSMSVAYFDDADDARAFIREKGLREEF